MHPIYLPEADWLNRLCTTPRGIEAIAYPSLSQRLQIPRSTANVLCAILELPIIVTSTAKPCVRR